MLRYIIFIEAKVNALLVATMSIAAYISLLGQTSAWHPHKLECAKDFASGSTYKNER